MNKKYYTLEEANAVLPEIRRVVAKVRSTDESRHEKQKALTEILLAIASNGGDFEEAYVVKLTKAVEQAERQIRRRLQYIQEKFHCEVKGFEPILVDFHSIREGREVYLCWKEDESEITHWHDLDAGFAGRRPL